MVALWANGHVPRIYDRDHINEMEMKNLILLFRNITPEAGSRNEEVEQLLAFQNQLNKKTKANRADLIGQLEGKCSFPFFLFVVCCLEHLYFGTDGVV